MALPEILRKRFLVHDGGPDGVWSLDETVLAVLFERVAPGMRTLETGAGMSTVLFAVQRAHHTCIVPSSIEVERIRAHCEEHGVPVDRLDFIVGASERVLPQLDRRELDLVLIDGRHGFPAPMLDWYFTAPMLRVGGLLLLDDTQLWTVRLVCDVLEREPEWRLEREVSRTALFVKLAEGSQEKEWDQQRQVLAQTEAMALAAHYRRRRATAIRLLRRGRLLAFARAVGRAIVDR